MGSPDNSPLGRVFQGNLCAGCGACAALAPGSIRMEYRAPGFLRPTVIEEPDADENAAIAEVCPGLGQTVDAAGRKTDALWGPYTGIWTGHANDPDQRHGGASGGALTALSAYLLASGKVSGVLSIVPDPDRPIANVVRLARTYDAVLASAGSRYAPSAPLAALPEILAEVEGPIAFIGKPCDAVALRAMSARDATLAERIPIVLSFFCAGVPALAGAASILDALGTSEAEIGAFRYRGQGWPGRATATLRTGETRSMSYLESWGGILSNHVQFRCKICADGTGKAADIACADAWECDERGYPLFDEADGRSLVMARTELGRALVEEAKAAGALSLAPFDIETLADMQPGQSGRRRVLGARLLALKLMGRPMPDYRGLTIAASARQGRPGILLRNFLGMFRRAWGQGRERGRA